MSELGHWQTIIRKPLQFFEMDEDCVLVKLSEINRLTTSLSSIKTPARPTVSRFRFLIKSFVWLGLSMGAVVQAGCLTATLPPQSSAKGDPLPFYTVTKSMMRFSGVGSTKGDRITSVHWQISELKKENAELRKLIAGLCQGKTNPSAVISARQSTLLLASCRSTVVASDVITETDEVRYTVTIHHTTFNDG